MNGGKARKEKRKRGRERGEMMTCDL